MIFQFLTLKDVFKFKFLSRKANSIYFFVGKKHGLDFLISNAKKIFEPESYYETMKYLFVHEICNKMEEKFTFSTRLFVRYFLENFLRMTTISNTLLHLFYCPRSFFSKSECKLCSRLFLQKEMGIPIEFSILSRKNTLISEKEYQFNFFWVDKDQKDIINSDIKRCLNTVIIQDSRDFLLYFFEIQGRYYCNFFKSLVEVLSFNRSEKSFFIELSSSLLNSFFCYILRHVNLNSLNELFEQVEFNQFQHLKVINKKYKEYLKNKYEN